ncbi:hypothetical protein CQ017_13565 [Arthrobacter sp. MYb224]|uniref:GAP family protein n=1 Tax=Arthrobacter sp. MYb224 TaxID=1848600 RepID=UPI000CFD8607|nr:GAP family protein [Arthrobacter sp. MYb224]PQZ97283.1 hypothetical protein CQ017_13565 [Arthrobacter sp. MYb224]
MNFLMQSPGLMLLILALIDATSIGTLVIPIWLLLRRDYRRAIPRVIVYLGLLAAFYWVIGVLIGSGWNLGAGLVPAGFFQHPTIRLLSLLLGAGMIIWALTYKTDAQKAAALRKSAVGGASRERAEPTDPATPGAAGPQIPKNLRGFLARALDSKSGIAVLALVAGLLELPTMLPYLGAMAILKQSGWSEPMQLSLLAIYCVVMIVPGLIFAAIRAAAGDRLDNWLQRVGRKLGGYAQETLGWVVGIAGFLIIRAALDGMSLGDFMSRVFNS